MKILLAAFIMTNHLGWTTVQPCVHIPLHPDNTSVEMVIEYQEYFSDDTSMRLLHRSVKPLTLARTSRHCFGPYAMQTGAYLIRVILTTQQNYTYQQRPFQVVGEDYRSVSSLKGMGLMGLPELLSFQ